MGIPIVPPPKVDGLGCALCFPENQTPVNIWCTIAGIAKGPFWLPGMAEPTNGSWGLTWLGGCAWQRIAGDWEVTYGVNPEGSWVTIFVPPFHGGVTGTSIVKCNSWFSLAAMDGRPEEYVGGYAFISMTADCPIVSLSALAESVGLHPGADLLADMWAKDDDEAVIRYAHKRDATNVKILLDCS